MLELLHLEHLEEPRRLRPVRKALVKEDRFVRLQLLIEDRIRIAQAREQAWAAQELRQHPHRWRPHRSARALPVAAHRRAAHRLQGRLLTYLVVQDKEMVPC